MNLRTFLIHSFGIATLSALSLTAAASSSALERLKNQQSEIQVMDDSQLSELRGGDYTTYQVTWKGIGSISDYRSYWFQGTSNTPGGEMLYEKPGQLARDSRGNIVYKHGFEYQADMKSKRMGTWSLANAYSAEYDINLGSYNKPYAYPGRYTYKYWNRPSGVTRW